VLSALKHAGIQELAHVVKLVKDFHTQSKEVLQEFQSLNNIVNSSKKRLNPWRLPWKELKKATDYLRLDIKSITMENLIGAVQEKLPNRSLLFKIKT